MPELRSRTTTHGRNMAGARALWRATGMKDGDFSKPIIAVVNSFTQFVPGHVHLKDLGQMVARDIEAAGGVAKEFNTIAVDDGIAMVKLWLNVGRAEQLRRSLTAWDAWTCATSSRRRPGVRAFLRARPAGCACRG